MFAEFSEKFCHFRLGMGKNLRGLWECKTKHESTTAKVTDYEEQLAHQKREIVKIPSEIDALSQSVNDRESGELTE